MVFCGVAQPSFNEHCQTLAARLAETLPRDGQKREEAGEPANQAALCPFYKDKMTLKGLMLTIPCGFQFDLARGPNYTLHLVLKGMGGAWVAVGKE